jgi:hypothetical protein
MTMVVHAAVTVPAKADYGGVTTIVEASPLKYSDRKPLMLR